jgi:hypothetical protein
MPRKGQSREDQKNTKRGPRKVNAPVVTETPVVIESPVVEIKKTKPQKKIFGIKKG